ncbi:nucleotidyl cyclase domain-containing protein [Micromonospora coxensis]|uniref:Guanylate cyclase domain-containing protein n=1 Tax=Micromonospora coxensis TaxID=356852 RepID=A0A1C5JBI7_9ACTN|nr:hypothetical protein [Micromonospora coxensis]SCG67964.1 hypothetical protein GA0070614_4323 [Micromonospora coxensis]
MELPRPWTAISSDIVDSSPGGYPRHSDLALAAESIMSRVEQACPNGGSWIHRERGDGELVLVPADVPVAWVLARFLDQVRVEVGEYNRNKNAESRLRLRIGIDFGDVQVDTAGIPRGGDAIVHAVRLQSCAAARDAMLAVPDAPVVAVVSDTVYQRVVPHQALGVQPRMFRRVRAHVPAKGFDATAWLHLPGYPPPWVSADDPAPAGDLGPDTGTPPDGHRADPTGSMPRPRPPRADQGRTLDGRRTGDNVGQVVYGDHATVTNHGGIGNGRNWT